MNITVHNTDDIEHYIDSDEEYENTKASELRQRKRKAQIGAPEYSRF